MARLDEIEAISVVVVIPVGIVLTDKQFETVAKELVRQEGRMAGEMIEANYIDRDELGRARFEAIVRDMGPKQ